MVLRRSLSVDWPLATAAFLLSFCLLLGWGVAVTTTGFARGAVTPFPATDSPSPATATHAELANAALTLSEDPAGVEVYLQQIKPLLAVRCYACHGALKQEADLRLDTVAAIQAGGGSGPAVVAGRPDESLILQRVATHELDQRMPPEHEGEAFNWQQIEQLRQWIAAGAPGPDGEQPEPDPQSHWSFQPLSRPAVPVVKASDWVQNPIDAFIAADHERLGLVPASPAAPGLLYRRLSLDLLGLPPTMDEAWRVQQAPSDFDYPATVAAMLADPRHGQRWARHWMDIWRYSDWWGLGDEMRNSQKHIHHWRDWIVENLNADRSYADMLRLMLAADELTPLDPHDLRATGFLARNYYLFNRHPWMEETVEHVGKALLGLTTNCAKCHDHKYDPIDQTEYYALRAFFEPYHVRKDMLPGEPDLIKDSLPRVYDGWLDAPTYRLIRGDEKQPDTSRVIAPAVPAFLQFAELPIEPVELPPAAWQPDRQTWVVENHVTVANQRVVEAAAALEAAEAHLTSAAAHWESFASAAQVAPSPDAADTPPAQLAELPWQEDFESLDASRWQAVGGNWEHHDGRVRQLEDGPQQAGLRWRGDLPADFVVAVTLQIHGGSQWRSVGISFDETQSDPTVALTAEDSAQHVYISAYAGGPKLQGSFRQGAQWQYPGEAAIAQPVALDQTYVLRLQVRGTLVNAYLDDRLVLAWRTPLARRPGHLQLTTFDALASFHHVEIGALADNTAMVEAANQQPDPATWAGARWQHQQAVGQVEIASAKWRWAQAELASVRARGEAAAREATVSEEQRADLLLAAAQQERLAAVAAAAIAVAEAKLPWELARLNEQATVPESLQQAVREAEAKWLAAQEQVQQPATTYTRLVGARWTPTRFQFSGQDDPDVPFPATSTGRRSALAHWVVDPRNPLTARVAVNHVWTRHFGQPLVPTVFDFGRNGQPPTHPELLDWLACELIDSGWSLKHLHRLIVNSATYQMATEMPSRAAAMRNQAIDPDNRFYWRRPTNRMESQVVRDSLLELAGQLDHSPGGPAILSAEQANSRRRSLYFFHSNNERNTFLTTFDEAAVAECYRREQSVVPQQSLALANSRLVQDQLEHIATRITVHPTLAGAGEPARDRQLVELSFVGLLGRPSNAQEMERCLSALQAWRTIAGENAPSDAAEVVPRATRDAANETPDKDIDAAGVELTPAVVAQLVWVLLNHNDFVSIY